MGETEIPEFEWGRSNGPAGVRCGDDIDQGGGAVGDEREAVRGVDVDDRGEVLACGDTGANGYSQFVRAGSDGGNRELGAVEAAIRSHDRRAVECRALARAGGEREASWELQGDAQVGGRALDVDGGHVVERGLGWFTDVLQQDAVEIQPLPG